MFNYIPHTEKDISDMLAELNLSSLEELYSGLRSFQAQDIPIPEGKSQQLVDKEFNNLSKENKLYNSIFLGAGAYNHYIPAAVKALPQGKNSSLLIPPTSPRYRKEFYRLFLSFNQ